MGKKFGYIYIQLSPALLHSVWESKETADQCLVESKTSYT